MDMLVVQCNVHKYRCNIFQCTMNNNAAWLSVSPKGHPSIINLQNVDGAIYELTSHPLNTIKDIDIIYTALIITHEVVMTCVL